VTGSRPIPRFLTLLSILAVVGCTGGGGSPAASSPAASPPAASASGPAGSDGGASGGADDQALIDAAKAEGTLTTIALPHDWCNYGEAIEAFKAKYGLEVNELDPNAGSGDELEAIRANKDNPGPQSPDVIDVGIAFGDVAKEEGLIQPYQVATWDSIPDEFKDPEGYWYGDYYGVLSFEVNKAVIENSPQDWQDLLKPEYADSVALAGDPRSSNQAIQSVYAAALANGGSLDDAQPGLDFFKQLNEAGNFVPIVALTASLAQGETPIVITWSYLAVADQQTLAGNPEIEVVVPASGRFAGVYAQAISAYAPHPNAAKLWMEYLYSDEGQAHWLKGYCHTARFQDLVDRGVHADLVGTLPDIEGAVFPSGEQLEAATELITTQWDSVVGVDVTEQ
jgi:putative spermidine/putrescine transport system substrate-binding protein